MAELLFLALFALCVSCAGLLASVRRLDREASHYHARIRTLEDYAVGLGKRLSTLEDDE